MSDPVDKKLTETLRVTVEMNGKQTGTLTGKRAEADAGDLVEVVLDGLPNQPVWLLEDTLVDRGDEYEASIECQYPTDSPEEAALSLIAWLTGEGNPGEVTVQLKDSRGVQWTIDVDWLDGIPTASLEKVVAYKKAGGGAAAHCPDWAAPLVTAAAAARAQRQPKEAAS